MTEQEAIKNINTYIYSELESIPKQLLESLKLACFTLKEVEQYREIGTPEECMAAVEKQTEKKPIRNDKCTCPSCGTHNEVFKKRRNTDAHDIVYCWHCGQALKIFRSDEE